MKNLLLIITALLIHFHTWGHQDSNYKFTHENVTVIFNTGYDYEEIKNAEIIGKYASLLCKEYGDNRIITLLFEHDYFNSRTHLHTNKIDFPDNKDSLTLFFLDYHFDIKETLNLLAYGFENEKKLRKKHPQKDTIVNYFYRSQTLLMNHIEDEKICQAIITDFSKVNTVLKTKIYRDNTYLPHYAKHLIKQYNTPYLYQDSLSYFTQNNQYYIFLQSNNYVVDTVSSVFKMAISRESCVQTIFIFKTTNTFDRIPFKDECVFSDYTKLELSLPTTNELHTLDIDVQFINSSFYLIKFYSSFSGPTDVFIFDAKKGIVTLELTEFMKAYSR